MLSPAAAPQEPPSLWSTLKEAVRGSHQDYTNAPIGRAVVLLAVPMVLEMMMESIFVVADVFFVGRLGPDAVTTVGITESLMTVMYTLAIGLSIGAAVTVARRVGEKDHDKRRRALRGAVGRDRVRSRGRLRNRGRHLRPAATPLPSESFCSPCCPRLA